MSDPQDLAQSVKSTWSVADREQAELVHEVTMCTSAPRPCNSQCPWLVASHGKTVQLFYDHEAPGIPMPEGEFAFAPWKRARVWEIDLKDGLDGYGSLCHVRLAGTQQTPDHVWHVVSRQCTGALVMQQREVLRHVEHGQSALTRQGAARVASDMLGRQVAETELLNLDVRELLEHAHPSLLDPQIGSEAVASPISERELHEWSRLPDPDARA
jgi:hypothetical protein